MTGHCIRTPAVTRRAATLSDDMVLEFCALEREAFAHIAAKHAAEQLGECFGNVTWFEPARIAAPAERREAA